MKVELAHRLNAALSGIDTAKTELANACNTGNDARIEEVGDRYEDARAEMGATMKAIAESGERPEQPPA